MLKNSYDKNDVLRKLVLSKAVSPVGLKHLKLDGIDGDDGRMLDIAVSCDGTWHTRGHKSHVGAVFVIDILTGLVIDLHIMSTYCFKCDSKQTLKESSPEEFAKWEADHLGSGQCTKNFLVSIFFTQNFLD